LSEALAAGPLLANAVVLAEVSPRFARIEDLETALPERLLVEELPRSAAFLAGHAHASYRRSGGAREQILADFLIASHAASRGGRCSRATQSACRATCRALSWSRPEREPRAIATPGRQSSGTEAMLGQNRGDLPPRPRWRPHRPAADRRRRGSRPAG
jgi:hypothetical protein